MSNLPSLKTREVVDILFAAGFAKVRTKGSHIRLVKGARYVTVPFKSKGTIPTGTFKNIVRQSGISQEKFLSLRRKQN